MLVLPICARVGCAFECSVRGTMFSAARIGPRTATSTNHNKIVRASRAAGPARVSRTLNTRQLMTGKSIVTCASTVENDRIFIERTSRAGFFCDQLYACVQLPKLGDQTEIPRITLYHLVFVLSSATLGGVTTTANWDLMVPAKRASRGLCLICRAVLSGVRQWSDDTSSRWSLQGKPVVVSVTLLADVCRTLLVRDPERMCVYSPPRYTPLPITSTPLSSILLPPLASGRYGHIFNSNNH